MFRSHLKPARHLRRRALGVGISAVLFSLNPDSMREASAALPAAVERILSTHAEVQWPELPYLSRRNQIRHPFVHGEGATTPVTSCDDAGAGTLRDAAASAASGDTLDLTQLTCSFITLTTGAIEISVDDLAIVGPGANVLAIEANLSGRAFHHTGSGTLVISELAMVDGRYYNTTEGADAKGGCIYSHGSVGLVDDVVFNCNAFNEVADAGIGAGAGIYAQTSVSVVGSYIASNIVLGFVGKGGGVATTHFAADSSYIGAYFLGNVAYSTGPTHRYNLSPGGGGGAVYAADATITNTFFIGNSTQRFGQPGAALMLTSGQSTVSNSTFFRNSGDGYGGAIYVPFRLPYAGWYRYCYDTSLSISNTTITGNTARTGGGIYSGCALRLSNSTLTDNFAIGFLAGRGGGLLIAGQTELNSSLIANNASTGPHPDLDARNFIGPAALTGRNNLIANPAISVPRDTIIGVDPLVGPLAANGGPVPTVALLAGSPAIDAGNNRDNLDFDARGPGFARVAGTRADIGAYEVQDTPRETPLFEGSFERVSQQTEGSP